MPAPVILALAASPRAGGNTDRLLDAFLEVFPVDHFRLRKRYLHKLSLHPCGSCGGCLEKGACLQKDDMEVIYRDLAEASGMVLASPVYFMGVTAQAKTVIDRCQALWVAKYKLGRPIYPTYRPGAFISVAGQRRPGTFECSLKTVRAFFNTVQFKLRASLLADGLDEILGGGIEDPLLEEARRCGRMVKNALEAA